MKSFKPTSHAQTHTQLPSPQELLWQCKKLAQEQKLELMQLFATELPFLFGQPLDQSPPQTSNLRSQTLHTDVAIDLALLPLSMQPSISDQQLPCKQEAALTIKLAKPVP